MYFRKNNANYQCLSDNFMSLINLFLPYFPVISNIQRTFLSILLSFLLKLHIFYCTLCIVFSAHHFTLKCFA